MQSSSSPDVSSAALPQSASSALQNLSDLLAKISVEDINSAERCGGGGFGDVYVLPLATIGKLALKRIRIAGNQGEVDSQIRRASREAETWRGLDHPNILPFLDVFERSGYMYLVSPFVQNGALSEFTQRHPNVDCTRLIQEAAAGIAYLHRCGIVHGDIKGANILVSDDIRSLLCDFGLAREQQNKTSTEMQGIGTVRWQSPELLASGAGRSFKSDVWAFGMTIYEILSGHIPYHECDSITSVIIAVFVLKQRPPKEPATSPTGTSYNPLWEVAGDCWQEDPAERPEIQEAYSRLTLGGTSFPRDDAGTRNNPHLVSSPTAQPLDADANDQARADPGSAERAEMIASGSTSAQSNRTRRSDRTTASSIQPRSLHKDGVLGKHEGEVYCVGFSPDGKTIASGATDDSLLLWDVEAGNQRGRPLKGHTRVVTCLAFSSDGATIASGSWDYTLRLWDVESGSQRGEPLRGHTDVVRCLAFSQNGTIASGSNDKTLRLWDPETRSKIGKPLKGHTDCVYCLSFSPDGTTIASGSRDNTILLWDVESWSQRGEPLKGHTSMISCVAFSPNGKTIASGSWDHTLLLWDVEGGCQRGNPLKGHVNTVTCLAFSPDGTTIVSGSDDTTLRFWDVEAGTQKGEPLKGHNCPVSCLEFSPDGSIVASGSDASAIRLWDVEVRSRESSLMRSEMMTVSCLAFSLDGTTLASGARDGTILLWDMRARRQRGAPLTGHTNRVSSLAFSPNGTTLISGSHDGSIRLWDVKTKTQRGQLSTIHMNVIQCLALSPDGTVIATGCNYIILLWDIEAGCQRDMPLRGHTDEVRCLSFSPDGRTIVSGGRDGIIRLWEV